MPRKPVSKTNSRMNEDLKRELVKIIGEMKDPRLQGGLVTVTRVEAAPDLSSCKVYVSMLGPGGGAKEVAAALEKAKGHVRSEVAARMHIRRAPEFSFIADDGAAYAAHINQLLNDL